MILQMYLIINFYLRLPTLVVDDIYISKLTAKKDEALRKCVVCMENFELKDVLKTLPCCKLIK